MLSICKRPSTHHSGVYGPSYIVRSRIGFNRPCSNVRLFQVKHKKAQVPYLVFSLGHDGIVWLVNPPFPVLSVEVMTDKPDKQCVLAQPLGLSTSIKPQQWSHEDGEQHTEHRAEWPTSNICVLNNAWIMWIMWEKQGSTKCPTENRGND